MKKTLVCAALVAAGLATAVAQNVYSLNVVGYYNLQIPANQYVLIANQLNTTNNSLSSLLPVAPDGSQVLKYNGGYTVFTYDELEPGWLPNGDATLNPGEGAFFRTPVATTLTFVGEVMQGSLTNTTPIGVYAIRSSMVPQAGLVSGVLGLPAEDGDQVLKYSGGYTVSTYDELEPGWLPAELSFGVGESFFVKKAPTSTQGNWVRNFTVN